MKKGEMAMNKDFSKVKVGDRWWSAETAPKTGEDVLVFTIDKVCRIVYFNSDYKKWQQRNSIYETYFTHWMKLPDSPKPEMLKTFDPNKPYQRRDGRNAEIVKKLKQGKYCVVTPSDDDSCDVPYEVGLDGGQFTYRQSEYDLVNIPEKIEGWVNVYPDMVHETKEVADKHNYKRGTPIRVACIQVSFPKGEGIPDNDFTEKWGYLNGSSVLK